MTFAVIFTLFYKVRSQCSYVTLYCFHVRRSLESAVSYAVTDQLWSLTWSVFLCFNVIAKFHVLFKWFSLSLFLSLSLTQFLYHFSAHVLNQYHMMLSIQANTASYKKGLTFSLRLLACLGECKFDGRPCFVFTSCMRHVWTLRKTGPCWSLVGKVYILDK